MGGPIHFPHRLLLFYSLPSEEPSYMLHVTSEQNAEFIGKRWNKVANGRGWTIEPANYRQSKGLLIQVKFLWKGERKRIMFVENILFARMLREWFQPGNAISNWEVKFMDPTAPSLMDDDVPF